MATDWEYRLNRILPGMSLNKQIAAITIKQEKLGGGIRFLKLLHFFKMSNFQQRNRKVWHIYREIAFDRNCP